jgi:hypothetical protein
MASRGSSTTGVRLTEAAVTQQLDAMGARRYDVGLREEVADGSGRFLRREQLELGQVLKLLPWLRRQNAHREHIYVRPSGERHALVLVDDLDGVSAHFAGNLTVAGALGRV